MGTVSESLSWSMAALALLAPFFKSPRGLAWLVFLIATLGAVNFLVRGVEYLALITVLFGGVLSFAFLIVSTIEDPAGGARPGLTRVALAFVVSTFLAASVLRAIRVSAGAGLPKWLSTVELGSSIASGATLGMIILGLILIVSLVGVGSVVRRDQID